MTTNGTGTPNKESLLKAITSAFNAYVNAPGAAALQAAWLAYQRGRNGPDAERLKAAYKTVRTEEPMKAWRAYEAARAAFKLATGERAPQMRFPKATDEAAPAAKPRAKATATA